MKMWAEVLASRRGRSPTKESMTKRTAKQRRVIAAVESQTLPLCIEFILDETSSMNKIATQTVDGFNDFLNEQRDIPGECRMTLTKFSNRTQRVPYEDLDLNYVPDMTMRTFVPYGGTNLYDTIGFRAHELSKRLEKWSVKPRVLFVVMTDGDDNQSRTHDTGTISEFIEQNPEWTFVYLGADQDALSIGEVLGFPEGNIRSFASEEIQHTMQDLSAATTVFRSATTATKSFF